MSIVYAMYDALVSINVPDEKAKAVIDAMEREMMGKFATKDDLAALRSEMAGEFKLVRHEMGAMHVSLSKDIRNLENVLTIKLGSIAVVLTGVLFGLLKFAS